MGEFNNRMIGNGGNKTFIKVDGAKSVDAVRGRLDGDAEKIH